MIKKTFFICLVFLIFFLFISCQDPGAGEPTPTPTTGIDSTPTPGSTEDPTPVSTLIPLGDDAYEEDDDYLTAHEILYETDTHGTYDQFHTMYPVGDEDWLYFSATAGETYVIELYPVYGGLNNFAGSSVYIIDTDGSTELDSEYYYYDETSPFTWTCPGDGTYYIRIVHNSDTGHYIIYLMHLVNGFIEIELD